MEYSVSPMVATDRHVESPSRFLSPGRIAAAIAESVRGDIVGADARHLVADGSTIQLLPTERAEIRAVVRTAGALQYGTLEEALAVHGKDVLGEGETQESYAAARDPQRREGAPVIFYRFDKIEAAAPRMFAPPRTYMDGDRIEASIHLTDDRGRGAAVCVYAVPLDEARRAVNSYRMGAPVVGLDRAQEDLVYATTTVVAMGLDEAGKMSSVEAEYTINSAPVVAYVHAKDLKAGPAFLMTDSGVALKWKNEEVILSRGVEGIRCLLMFKFGKVFVVYERQVSVMDLYEKDGVLTSSLVICNMEITGRLVEAASLLLKNDGDVAAVCVYTPSTASTTTNAGSGWFVIEGNIGAAAAAAAMSEAGVPSPCFESREDALDHYGEHWRTFLHARFSDGRQVVIMDPKMRLAGLVSALPLRRVRLSECEAMGGAYMSSACRAAATSAVGSCTYHATLRDPAPDAGVKDSMVLFYDPHGAVRMRTLMAVLREEFKEETVPNGTRLLISPDFADLLDQTQPQAVRSTNQKKNARGLLSDGVEGREICMSFMERFVRAVISVIYVNYGTLPAETSEAPQTAALIYRTAMRELECRFRAISLIFDGFEWLTRNTHLMSGPLMEIWEASRAHAGSPRKHKDYFGTYVINRPAGAFGGLADNLLLLEVKWRAGQRANKANKGIKNTESGQTGPGRGHGPENGRRARTGRR